MVPNTSAEETGALPPGTGTPNEPSVAQGPKPSLLQRYKARVMSEWSTVSQNGIHRVFARLILPIDVIMVCVFIMVAIWEDTAMSLLKLFGLYYVTPFGMEVGVAVAIDVFKLDPYLTIGFMLWVDMVSAWLLLWNFWFFKVFPFLGFLLDKTEIAGHKAIRKYPWIERLEFFGVAAFVMIPLYGTGAIIGTIVGKALDFHPWKTWFAVVLGSGMRLSLLTFYAVWLRAYVSQFWFWVIFGSVIAGIFAITTLPQMIRQRRQQTASSSDSESS